MAADIPGPHPVTAWNDVQFRAIDDSIGTLLRQLLVAMAGLYIAFIGVGLLGLRVVGPLESSTDVLWGGLAFAAAGFISILLTSALPIRASISAQRAVMTATEARLASEIDHHRFSTNLQEALDMADSEGDAVAIVERALALTVDRPAELLLADSSRAHLRQAGRSPTHGAPGCAVASPWACPAVRRAQVLHFSSSADLAACPHLTRLAGPCSAVCVPVTVLGTPMGVLHTSGAEHASLAEHTVQHLVVLAQHAGARIGMLRAMQASQLQASTDALTGVANRRVLDDRLQRLTSAATNYAIVFADLDRFKVLNDTYGHATGDRALRLFVETLNKCVRDDDLVARYGGEEFVLLLPCAEPTIALEVVDRIRLALTEALDNHDLPRFTATFGVAHSTQAETPTDVVRLADVAMYAGKTAGRDRVIVA